MATRRERASDAPPDDPAVEAFLEGYSGVAGDPTGHFVVVVGYEHYGRRFTLRDPSEHVPVRDGGRVVVDAQRLINAILLGDATYDAVLLELWPDAREGA